MILKEVVVFYHRIDFDGVGAKEIFKQTLGDECISYIGLNNGMMGECNYMVGDEHYLTILEKYAIDCREVWFLDIAPRTQAELDTIESLKIPIGIIDHHQLKYKIEKQPIIRWFNHEEGVSACMLTWQYLHTEEPPLVVELINDRDVWINGMQPQTNYFNNCWGMLKENEVGDLIYRDDNFSLLNNWLAVGKIRETTNQKLIQHQVENIKTTKIDNLTVAHTHNIEGGILSETGNKLCEAHPYVDLYINTRYDKKRDMWNHQCRSLKGEALQYIRNRDLKGGGHPNACGFTSELPHVPTW